jgi:RNA polymerase sigma-70 factor (ECF subfamily)|tara:strand:- start:182 stop:784 length:603 start_codon:yes stop_codon:yes gene_type:complete
MKKQLSDKGKRDLALINRALETGDKKAYNELMRLYRDPLYFMLLEKVGNEELAKDLTIEALGKAFKKLHLYVPNYVFSTWLFTIAKNNCIDYLRKNKLPTISIDKLTLNDKGEKQSFDIPSEIPDPEKMMMKKQRVQILRQIVEQLKPNYRILVRLRYFKEMSYKEIATELEVPLGTVKAQLHRSREQLFNIMSGKKGAF